MLVHILPNTLRSKGIQTKKSGHLIEDNIRNIFLEKEKCGGEISSRSFS